MAGSASSSLAEWLDELRAALSAGGTAPPDANLDLSRGEQRALLDLTRVAAHSSERIAAPLSAFVLGAAWASVASDERERRLRDLTARLEQAGGAAAEG